MPFYVSIFGGVEHLRGTSEMGDDHLASSKKERHPIINAAYYCHGTSQRFGNDKPLSFEDALEGLLASICTGTVFGIDVPTRGYLTSLFVFACNDGTESSRPWIFKN